MARTLKIKFQKNCIGCELCVLEAQRQLKKVGLEGALIRILKNKDDTQKNMEFYIELDPRINQINIDKIARICPTGVFEITEEDYGSSFGF
jgi:NAD-dependent dihydropyrimidine dehydrogenase PreA subunit